MPDKFDNVVALLALWGSVGVTVTGICVAVIKYKQWQRTSSAEFKQLRLDVDELKRGRAQIEKDCQDSETRWKSAIRELTDWVKWMFDK